MQKNVSNVFFNFSNINGELYNEIEFHFSFIFSKFLEGKLNIAKNMEYFYFISRIISFLPYYILVL